MVVLSSVWLPWLTVILALRATNSLSVARKKLELKEIGRDQPVFSFTEKKQAMSSTGSVFQTASSHCMFLAEITFLLSVLDFPAVNNSLFFTNWV